MDQDQTTTPPDIPPNFFCRQCWFHGFAVNREHALELHQAVIGAHCKAEIKMCKWPENFRPRMKRKPPVSNSGNPGPKLNF